MPPGSNVSVRPIFCWAVAKLGMKPVLRRGMNVKSVTIIAAVTAEPAIIGTQRTEIEDNRNPVKAEVNQSKNDSNHATKPNKMMNCDWNMKTEPARKIVGHKPAGEI